MFSIGSNNTKRNMGQNKRDTIEIEKSSSHDGSLSSFATDTAKNVGNAFGDLGKGMFDQLLGNYEAGSEKQLQREQKVEEPKKGVENKTLFNYRNIEEERQMSEIKELIKMIKQEVDAIKRADASLMGDVKDIEKLAINNLPEKPGVYHVRFLELVLKMLQLVKTKINESHSWMQALMSKKQKRGSAFAARSKKQGTQYSMSQELSNARSIQ